MADLELRHITKSFNGNYALNDVSFSCNRGEVHALLGENGAGKSTLLKVLAGAYRPDSGEIHVFGEKAEIHNPADAMRYGIGCVYQELSFIPDLTVAENIFIGRIPKTKFGSFDYKKLRKMTLELMEKYDVDEIDPNAKAGEISLSQKQIIEILKILSKNPEIIILDEATSALHENRVKWLLQLARKLADSGKIVIFISHRMAEIKDGCDNITILRNGTYAGDLPVNDNLDMDEVISMMLGRKMSSYFPQITDCSMDEDALELKDVRYRNILNGVNLKVKKGEVVGIGGLAGQGQAELLQALYGIYPVTGEIYFQGKKIHIKNPKDAINKKIALVPEERAIQGLFLQLGIDFNISITSVNKMSKGPIISKKKENSIVSKYMKALAVKAPTPQTPVQDLSGGNQQKVVMAKIISCEPELLLLHDITRGVDVGTKKEMFTLVREFAKEGNAVIFFSTDVEELVNVCDRVLVMYDGKIRANLKLETLTKEQIIGASIGANQVGGEGNEEK
ncbi:sugar ABC transporter ATP-binding protein [Dorea formicigenerans]|uniref:Galactose/methyl galactoside import ATP-binding protein MglA n=1 Tax=Dorea formicigenerans TaxID=39486 RepID=A0A564UCA9_9FIRM|nr:sugar ABC transporter ATP-binding protein [Dorea formicigenerans]VUX17107.1 Galactose/methyl galactoside import ATP-binding protein MglA [Dorea formicigenerans]